MVWPGGVSDLKLTAGVFGVEQPRPSVGPPSVTQPPRATTKAQGCKTRHRFVQALGQGDPLAVTTMEWLWIAVATCALASRTVKGKC